MCAALVAPLLLAACGGGTDPAVVREAVRSGQERLNLLVVTLDTTRADRLGCYGYAEAGTKRLDRLAERGVLFEQAIAPVPLTVPSHCSIFTGTLPPHHGVRTNEDRLDSDANLTLAEILRERGFATAAFLGAEVLARHCGLDQGFDRYADDFSGDAQRGGLAYPEKPAETVVRGAAEWIRAHAGGRFFAWVHLFDPHLPYSPPPAWRGERGGEPYDAEIAYADEWIGYLLDTLDRAGVADDTLVAFLSDHGEGLGEHGESTHGVFVYDSTLRVPLVLACPKILPAGKRVREQVRVTDVTPTVLDLLGIEPPTAMHGTSLLPLIDGEATPSRDAYAESYYAERVFGWSPLLALRSDGWKVIQAPAPELYELDGDPGETRNLYGAREERATPLLRKLESLVSDVTREGAAAGAGGADAATRAMLQRLGYLTGSAEPSSVTGARELADPKDRIWVVEELQRAATLVYEGRYPQALGILRQLEREEPDSPQVHTLAGEALVKSGDLLGARAAYLKLVDLDPRNDDALVNLGSIHLSRNEPRKAIPYFERALEWNPSNADALFSLGSVYWRVLGDPAKGRPYLERFVEVAPEDPQAPGVRALLRGR